MYRKQISPVQIFIAGLAIFAMLFGGGNLIYPIKAGLLGGKNFIPSMIGFLLTSVCLPFMGLLAIILFDGDYRSFFYRIGRIPGSLLILMCMLVIGPIIAMPRILTVSHAMLSPLLPANSFVVYAIVFLLITFAGAFKENKIIALFGYFVAPVLLASLGIIVVKGWYFVDPITINPMSGLAAFRTNIRFGLSTLDLFGTIFFGSLIVSIFKQNLKRATYIRANTLMSMVLYAGLIGFALLGIVYVGMASLGLMHGMGLEHINRPLLFSEVALTVLGKSGAFIIVAAILMACISTAIALSAVVVEYLQRDVGRNKISYIPALVFVLLLTFFFSLLGYDWILKISVMTVEAIGVPIVITITFANIAYKLAGFRPIKTPVAIVALYTTFMFVWKLLV
ncbi:hypothetical protein HOM50_00050 [bacterium]|nr:hypothetical protein [bacterium]MBT5014788.1 hypothetical protein [bacterium]